MQEFYEHFEERFRNFKPKNQNRFAKVRQQLQFLRDDGFLSFVDNRGTYTLRGVDLLEGEIEDDKIKEISVKTPERREYLIETFARNKGWVKQAKDKFGSFCMYLRCDNTFTKSNGAPYIEVHHIVPLCQGGEDGIWNLSVLCAHHHKMAHFADKYTRRKLRNTLLKIVESHL